MTCSRWRKVAVAASSLALLVAGCGDDDDTAATRSTTTRPRAERSTTTTAPSGTTTTVSPPASTTLATAPATTAAGPGATRPALAPTSTTTAAPPCPGPSVVLERAAPADRRVCVTMTLSTTTLRGNVDVAQGTVVAENRSTERVDISHPSGCPVWWGLYQDGRYVAGGPSTCAVGAVADSLGPREVRRWSFELHTCYGRGPSGGSCLEGAAPAGTFVAAAGVNVGPGGGGLAVDRVWFAPERQVAVT